MTLFLTLGISLQLAIPLVSPFKCTEVCIHISMSSSSFDPIRSFLGAYGGWYRMDDDQKQWLMDLYGCNSDQWMEYANTLFNNTSAPSSNHYFSHQDPYGIGIVTHSAHNHQYPSSVPPPQQQPFSSSPHDMQEIDEVEVEIISKATFDQAKIKAKSNHGTGQHGGRSRMDLQLGLGLAVGEPIKHSGLLVKEGEEAAAYRCPICMDKIMEATTTKCGHIFCQGCLRMALAVKKQCPTCRRKLRANSNMKVFLPEIF